MKARAGKRNEAGVEMVFVPALSQWIWSLSGGLRHHALWRSCFVHSSPPPPPLLLLLHPVRRAVSGKIDFSCDDAHVAGKFCFGDRWAANRLFFFLWGEKLRSLRPTSHKSYIVYSATRPRLFLSFLQLKSNQQLIDFLSQTDFVVFFYYHS